MNWLDYALIAIMAIGIISGMLTGPLLQVYRMFSVILSIAVAFLLNKIVSNILNGLFRPEDASIIGYAIVFFVVLIMTYVVGKFLKIFLSKMKFGMSGRVLGGWLGFLNTILICGIIILIASFTENTRTQEIVNGSLIASNLEKGARMVISVVPQNLKNKSFIEKKESIRK